MTKLAAPKLKAAPIDPAADAVFVRASRGELEAFRELLAYADDAASKGAISLPHAVWAAEIPARLAAAHGHASDRMYLARILLHMAQIDRDSGGNAGPSYQAEAVAILTDLAEEGDEPAADMVAQANAELPAETIEAALVIGEIAAASAITLH